MGMVRETLTLLITITRCLCFILTRFDLTHVLVKIDTETDFPYQPLFTIFYLREKKGRIGEPGGVAGQVHFGYLWVCF